MSIIYAVCFCSERFSQIIEFEMNDEEKEQLNQTLNAVKNTVSETGL